MLSICESLRIEHLAVSASVAVVVVFTQQIIVRELDVQLCFTLQSLLKIEVL